MSTGNKRKRKRDNHDSNGSNKRRKVDSILSINTNNLTNDTDSDCNMDTISQSQKQKIKRPPRNMKIKCAPNVFMILPKPLRHGLPEFILEVVSKAARDEDDRPINGSAKTKRLGVKEALKQHIKWHENEKLLNQLIKNVKLQNIRNINPQKKQESIENHKIEIENYLECIKNQMSKIHKKKKKQQKKKREKTEKTEKKT
eukprot:335222_1